MFAEEPIIALMKNKQNILVVDDDEGIATLVATLLSKEGFNADSCYSGEQALAAMHSKTYNLIVLDIMMPGIDGYETCRLIRSFSDVPIIFLSAKDEEINQVVGLEIGADDYIVKPFRTHEFIARVKARLRRKTNSDANQDDVVLSSGTGIEVNLETHMASVHETPLKLTPKEFGILSLLLKRKGATVSARELYEVVWESCFDSAAGNSVMVHIRHLREKLAAIDASKEFIVNVWGVGYKIPTAGLK